MKIFKRQYGSNFIIFDNTYSKWKIFFIFASISNCTYNFEFQNVNDDVTCHKSAETKAQGLRQHIQLLEEQLEKLKPKQSSDDNRQCKEKKEYTISYPGEM